MSDDRMSDAVDRLVAIPEQELGALVQQYLTQAHYDTQWEGFDSPIERQVIRALIEDMLLAWEHGLK